MERSTDQVIKPINLGALSKWVGAIPDDVKRDMRTIAPMLQRLGYDPGAYPPNYGVADQFVSDNTVHIRSNEDYWRKRGQDVVNMEKPVRHYRNGPPPGNEGTTGNKQDVYGKDFDDGKQNGDKESNNGDKLSEGS